MSNFQYIIITGNPVDGFMYYGPYSTHDEAIEAAEASTTLDGDDWWIARLWLNIDDEVKP